MNCRFQQYIVCMEIFSTFHAQVEYILFKKYAIQSSGTEPPQKTSLPLRAHRQIDECPSQPHLPPQLQLGWFTYFRIKVPIGYNGMPHIYLQNYPFPFNDHHPHLIHSSFTRAHSPFKVISGFNEQFCHSTLSGQTYQATHTWDKR